MSAIETRSATCRTSPGLLATEEDFDRLRGLGLSDAEILDVVLAAAARCFLRKTLDAVGVAPDAKYSELDPKIRAALTVGRAIARE